MYAATDGWPASPPRGPYEVCDGTDDAACPGLCLPPIDPNECKCPVCGDDSINQPSEQCDGGDDASCPGLCSATCLCRE